MASMCHAAITCTMMGEGPNHDLNGFVTCRQHLGSLDMFLVRSTSVCSSAHCHNVTRVAEELFVAQSTMPIFMDDDSGSSDGRSAPMSPVHAIVSSAVCPDLVEHKPTEHRSTASPCELPNAAVQKAAFIGTGAEPHEHDQQQPLSGQHWVSEKEKEALAKAAAKLRQAEVKDDSKAVASSGTPTVKGKAKGRPKKAATPAGGAQGAQAGDTDKPCFGSRFRPQGGAAREVFDTVVEGYNHLQKAAVSASTREYFSFFKVEKAKLPNTVSPQESMRLINELWHQTHGPGRAHQRAAQKAVLKRPSAALVHAAKQRKVTNDNGDEKEENDDNEEDDDNEEPEEEPEEEQTEPEGGDEEPEEEQKDQEGDAEEPEEAKSAPEDTDEKPEDTDEAPEEHEEHEEHRKVPEETDEEPEEERVLLEDTNEEPEEERVLPQDADEEPEEEREVPEDADEEVPKRVKSPCKRPASSME